MACSDHQSDVLPVPNSFAGQPFHQRLHNSALSMLILDMQDEFASPQERGSSSNRSDAAQSGDSFYTAHVRTHALFAMFLGCDATLAVYPELGLLAVRLLAYSPLG